MVVPKKAWPKVAASSITQVLQVPYLALSILYVKSPKKKKKTDAVQCDEERWNNNFQRKVCFFAFPNPEKGGGGIIR